MPTKKVSQMKKYYKLNNFEFLNKQDMSRITKRQQAILKLYENPIKTLEIQKKILEDNNLLDVLGNFYLPQDFNFDKIKQLGISKMSLQTFQIPFKNEDIKTMIDMPKVQVTTPKISQDMGKIYHSVYLLGNHNGNKMLYLLSVQYSQNQSKPPVDFHIKLDALVGGKTWFSLLRMDSIGKPHPNYFKDGIPCKEYLEVEKIRTPHLHRASYEAQLFTNTNSYSNAEEFDFLDYDNLNFADGSIFDKLLNNFLAQCHADVNIRDIAGTWFDFNNKNVFKPKIVSDDEVINWIL